MLHCTECCGSVNHLLPHDGLAKAPTTAIYSITISRYRQTVYVGQGYKSKVSCETSIKLTQRKSRYKIEKMEVSIGLLRL